MAGLRQGNLTFANGKKIRLLRVSSTGASWGSGDDMLRTEVIVQLEGDTQRAFGFDLHAGHEELPNHLGMLSLLKDAYIHDLPVSIAYWLEEGKNNGYIHRVEVLR